MTFKDFVRISEEVSGTDKGLMGFPIASTSRKPSDGIPFKDKLSSVAGQTPRGSSAATSSMPTTGSKGSFMKKK